MIHRWIKIPIVWLITLGASADAAQSQPSNTKSLPSSVVQGLISSQVSPTSVGAEPAKAAGDQVETKNGTIPATQEQEQEKYNQAQKEYKAQLAQYNADKQAAEAQKAANDAAYQQQLLNWQAKVAACAKRDTSLAAALRLAAPECSK